MFRKILLTALLIAPCVVQAAAVLDHSANDRQWGRKRFLPEVSDIIAGERTGRTEK